MLKPLKIGGIEIDFPVVLGALAGYSDMPYRMICRSLSAPYCASEAMLDRQVVAEGKLRRRLVRLDDADHPAAGQIMGSDPRVMAAAALVLREAEFDVIDLNFACPVRKVVSKKRGGYFMGEPGAALDIVRSVLREVPDRPVTLKLRRAVCESDGGHEAFWKIAHGAFDAGVAAIAVHARSVDQKYRGRADWEFLSSVKDAFPGRTVIGSGDVLAAADAIRMLRETGVDGVIAARGAIGNPWFFRQARDVAEGRDPFQPGLAAQREIMSRHFLMARELYGPKRGLKVMRTFGIHYARMHPRPAKVRMAFVNIRTDADWQAVLDAWYAEQAGPR